MILPLDEHRTVSQQVYRSLRQAILTGTLAPGQRLTETFLAAHFGTSRAPLREALLRLESEGLVISYPHRGTFVVELSETDVDEIYSIASLIEGFAGRLAVERASDADLKSLQDLVDAMRASKDAPDPRAEVAELDFQFHLRLVELSSHTRLLKLWLTLSSQFRMSMAASMEDYTRPNHLAEDMAVSHQEVVDALSEGDPDAAERRIRSRSAKIRRRVKRARRAVVLMGDRPAHSSRDSTTGAEEGDGRQQIDRPSVTRATQREGGRSS